MFHFYATLELFRPSEQVRRVRYLPWGDRAEIAHISLIDLFYLVMQSNNFPQRRGDLESASWRLMYTVGKDSRAVFLLVLYQLLFSLLYCCIVVWRYLLLWLSLDRSWHSVCSARGGFGTERTRNVEASLWACDRPKGQNSAIILPILLGRFRYKRPNCTLCSHIDTYLTSSFFDVYI